jgi:hypothetical protein
MTNGGIGVSELSDVELLASTRALIGRSNQVLAALLAHLGEVEAHGLHRTRACSSLCAYCIYEAAQKAGQRCRETHHLELHHLVPFARGGEHTAANLDLRCSAHNALAAELAVPTQMQQNLLGVTFSCALSRLQAHPPQRARVRYPRELARPDTHRAR